MKVYFCDVCGADMRAYQEYEMGVVNLYKRDGRPYIDEEPTDVFFDVCPECFEKVMNYIKGGAK